jgi:hypothetical protein
MAGQITISTLKDDAGVLATQNGMTGIAKAWVNFDGTGTPAIRDSFNVSSITDNGTGNYTVNFITAMPNANYSVQCQMSAVTTGTGSGRDCLASQRDQAVGSYRQISTSPANGALTDPAIVAVAVFSS